MLFNSGYYNQAYMRFEKALSIKPENRLYRFWLGRSLLQNGYYSAAREVWMRLADEGYKTDFLRNRIDFLNRIYYKDDIPYQKRNFVISHTLFQNTDRGRLLFSAPMSAHDCRTTHYTAPALSEGAGKRRRSDPCHTGHAFRWTRTIHAEEEGNAEKPSGNRRSTNNRQREKRSVENALPKRRKRRKRPPPGAVTADSSPRSRKDRIPRPKRCPAQAPSCTRGRP